MYRYLWSNGPKECLEFADYSFEEHFKQPIPSYPPRAVLEDYIQGRIKKSGIEAWVKFGHVAHNIFWDEDKKEFSVTVKNLSNKEGTTWTTQDDITEKFDYVYVCTGHFSVPNVPEFPGFDTYQGRILHSHDFRDAVEFANMSTMVIGASYSAEDIAS
jgi:trimethylamine monooxygenase